MQKSTMFFGIAALIAAAAIALAGCPTDGGGGDNGGGGTATFTVTFDSRGGSDVAAQTGIASGGMATAPTPTPTKAATPAEGLYLDSALSALPAQSTFDGWYSDTAYLYRWNFATPVTASITLYAKWTEPAATPIALSGGTNIVDQAVAHVNANAAAGAYTLVLKNDYSSANNLLDTANAKLTIVGDSTERKITYNGSAPQDLFTLGAASTTGISLTLGNNVTLIGSSTALNVQVVEVTNGATFTMKAGSKITGHKTSNNYGAVYIAGTSGATSNFVMEGGAITGNTSSFSSPFASGGVYVNSNSTMTMKGGSITDNSKVGNVASDVATGGVPVSLTLSGGASIGTLGLYANANGRSDVYLDGAFMGSIGILNLTVSSNTMTSAIGYWANAPVISPKTGYTLTAADIAKFAAALGNFLDNSGGSNDPLPIGSDCSSAGGSSSGYKIADNGADIGKLVAK